MSGERGPSPSPCFGPQGMGGFWTRSGMRKRLGIKVRKASWPAGPQACLRRAQMPDSQLMPRSAIAFLSLLFTLLFCAVANAQQFASDHSEKMLEALSKKIDEQNA